MELIVIFVLVFLVARTGAQRGHYDWQASRLANRRHSRGQRVTRRAWSAVVHDAGYWAHQVTHLFPQFRHGIASGWHAGRTAEAEGRAARAEALTGHLSARSRVAAAIREQRRRQEELLAEIRSQREGEAGEGSPGELPSAAACEHAGVSCTYDYCPCPCPGCGGARHQAADGATYSYGAAGNRSHWPARSRYEAESQAQYWSTGGTPQVVAEYPPEGGPGTTVSSWLDGDPQALAPGDTGTDTGLGVRAGPVMDCDLCGKPLPPGYAGIAHPACIAAAECGRCGGCGEVLAWTGGRGYVKCSACDDGRLPVTPSTTEGTTMSGDITYDGVLRRMAVAISGAEQRGAEVSAAKSAAGTMADEMQSLGVDSATLGAMADHLDALDAAEKAQQRVTETATAVNDALRRGHQGLSEAHKDAPVAAAQSEFYED